MADITMEPATWYSVTVRCETAQVKNPDDPDGDPIPCVNYQREWEVSPVYSNAGHTNVQCGPCQQNTEMLSATKLDPQPEVS
jgi:hypothetical protein